MRIKLISLLILGIMLITLVLFGLFSCGGGDASGPGPTFSITTDEGVHVEIPTSLCEGDPAKGIDPGLYLNIADTTILDCEEIIDYIKTETDAGGRIFVANNEKRIGTNKAWKVVRNTIVVYFNHFAFKCGAGLCSGFSFNDSNVIYASLYGYIRTNEFPAWNFPPHTLLTKEEMAEWSGDDSFLKPESENFWVGTSYFNMKNGDTIGAVVNHERCHKDGAGEPISEGGKCNELWWIAEQPISSNTETKGLLGVPEERVDPGSIEHILP